MSFAGQYGDGEVRIDLFGLRLCIRRCSRLEACVWFGEVLLDGCRRSEGVEELVGRPEAAYRCPRLVCHYTGEYYKGLFRSCYLSRSSGTVIQYSRR